MKRFAAIGVFLGLLLLGTQTSLGAYDHDFSTLYSGGESVEGATLGLATFTSESGSLVYSAGYGGGFLGNTSATSDIYIDFLNPVQSIQVVAGDPGTDYDRYAISAYAYGSNALLGTFETPQFNGPGIKYYSLTIPSTCVGRLVFDPGNGSYADGGVTLPGSMGGTLGVVLTELHYDAQTGPCPVVPAPGALLLCGIGAPVVAWLRRRRAF